MGPAPLEKTANHGFPDGKGPIPPAIQKLVDSWGGGTTSLRAGLGWSSQAFKIRVRPTTGDGPRSCTSWPQGISFQGCLPSPGVSSSRWMREDLDVQVTGGPIQRGYCAMHYVSVASSLDHKANEEILSLLLRR